MVGPDGTLRGEALAAGVLMVLVSLVVEKMPTDASHKTMQD